MSKKYKTSFDFDVIILEDFEGLSKVTVLLEGEEPFTAVHIKVPDRNIVILADVNEFKEVKE